MAAVGGPYSTWKGSPAERGKLQFDLWGVVPSDLWGGKALKAKIAQHGLRNSLLLAPMPTASTSQILGLNECFEPYTSKIYTRRVLSGEFQVVCPWLLRELVKHGLWDEQMHNLIVANNDLVQNINAIPANVKAIYETVWEISQKKTWPRTAARADERPAHEHALLRVEEGPQDGHKQAQARAAPALPTPPPSSAAAAMVAAGVAEMKQEAPETPLSVWTSRDARVGAACVAAAAAVSAAAAAGASGVEGIQDPECVAAMKRA